MAARRTGTNRDGFALIAVIWSLGLITLLAMAVMVGARYRTRVAANYASAIAAETAAESAINLAISIALNDAGERSTRFPVRCRMPGGERVLITVDEENGKIDLNTSSPAVLTRFFTRLTNDQSLGTHIAERILEQRKPAAKAAKAGSGPPASAPRFVTIMELDKIDGISPRLFRAAKPLVTVRSGRSEPDINAASPALRRLLQADGKPLSSAAPGVLTGGSITIRADVSAPDGARFVREALVSLAEGGEPYIVREWRRGDSDATAPRPPAPHDAARTAERACFRTAGIAR